MQRRSSMQHAGHSRCRHAMQPPHAAHVPSPHALTSTSCSSLLPPGEHDMAKKHFSQALNFDPDFKPAKEAFNSLKALERAKNRAQRALDEGGGRAGCKRSAVVLAQHGCRGSLRLPASQLGSGSRGGALLQHGP